jgi:hypothetical protein
VLRTRHVDAEVAWALLWPVRDNRTSLAQAGTLKEGLTVFVPSRLNLAFTGCFSLS